MNSKNPQNNSRPSVLIALGGNALSPPEKQGAPPQDEFQIARKSMENIVSLIQMGYEKIIITHGNAPQVGKIFLQQELTQDQFPDRTTLDECVADTEGGIGYILQNVFDNICLQRGIKKRLTTVITQVVVDAKDPAFQNPTKPIGPFYSRAKAEQLRKKYDWVIKEDAGRGYRRFIPSPEPLEIVEKSFFQELLKQNFIVIGAGGGGIPVIRDASGELRGVEAVIDKDKTSALLASELNIDCFVILTQVDHVFTDFNTQNQKPIRDATVNEIELLLKEGHFLEGSMKPKMESVVRFLKKGGKRAVVAHLYDLIPAMEGKTGTHITPV